MVCGTYLSTQGNMKKVCNAMERATDERDRKLVQKLRFIASGGADGVVFVGELDR